MANEMRERMKTGGGPPPPAALPTPELDLAVPHLGHNVGLWFDSDAAAGPSQGNIKIMSLQDIILHQMFRD